MSGPVFISHSSEDSDEAIALSEALRLAFNNQLRTFNTSSGTAILPGENWRTRIIGALESSSVVILWGSRLAIRSPEVAFEIGAAAALEKQIIPCCVHISPAELPWSLSEVQAVVTLDSDNGWIQLAESIAQAVEYPTGLNRLPLEQLAERFKAPSDALSLTQRGLTIEVENSSEAPITGIQLGTADEVERPRWLTVLSKDVLHPGESLVILRDRGEPGFELVSTWRDITGQERHRVFAIHGTGGSS